jgi:hypothetical protein
LEDPDELGQRLGIAIEMALHQRGYFFGGRVRPHG